MSPQVEIDHRQKTIESLLEWGEDLRRDLPWRHTRDSWAVLVSELMLQQTQVARVLPRFDAFMEQFPTPAACAAASPGAVIERWDGLGYNRRARYLHQAATAIVERHDGEVPDTLDALLALPGIGAYTARAVLAFAFEADHGVVDTNAARFLARAVAGRRLSAKEAQQLADAMVPHGQAWAWNQAVMDLGAAVCRKRDPSCTECPLAASCAWYLAGRPSPDPADGSAGTSTPQSKFDGSDRQGRGRLVKALRTGPVEMSRVPDAVGWPEDPERARRVADGLVGEGLAEYVDGMLSLPA